MSTLERIASLERKIAMLESTAESITPSSIPTAKTRIAQAVAGPEPYPTDGAKFYISFVDGEYDRTVDDPALATFTPRRTVANAICYNLAGTLPTENSYVNAFEWGGYWWTFYAGGSIPPERFVKITNAGTACASIGPDNYCVFQAKLVTYHGSASSACGAWTEGADVWVVATNQCGTTTAKIGDMYPAHWLGSGFNPPSGTEKDLYAIRTTDATQGAAYIQITGAIDGQSIGSNNYCVFEAQLITYDGSLATACNDWVNGADIWVVAINRWGSSTVRVGDQYPAWWLVDDFEPIPTQGKPLYAFRAEVPEVAHIKITEPGTNCDDVVESQYCHFSAALVSYPDNTGDACGAWTEGDPVWATPINRCGTNDVKIGDQYHATLISEAFDPGSGGDIRPLYSFRRGHSQKQIVKLAKTTVTHSPGTSHLVNIFRRDGGSPTITSPLEQETAYLDWMHSSEVISLGKEIVITWFEDEQIWRITGAECET